MVQTQEEKKMLFMGLVLSFCWSFFVGSGLLVIFTNGVIFDKQQDGGNFDTF